MVSSSKPKENTPLISPLLNPYSIVNVQENFNYDKPLTQSLTFPHSTPFTGPALVGSGIRTFSRFPLFEHEREKWSACDIGSGDCLTPKGFSAVRVTLAEGVTVDVYNLHAEAGDKDGDFAARQKGYDQLVGFISRYSKGNPIVLAGDTNTRYTAAKDPIRVLNERSGMTDVWVQLVRKGVVPPVQQSGNIECPFPAAKGKEDINCELIDKAFYRSNPLVRITPKSYKNENSKFLRPDGGPLSDHFPVAVDFDWEASPTLREGEGLAGRVGGGGGDVFNDVETLPQEFGLGKYGRVSEFQMRSGHRVDAVMYKRDGRALKHGGNGGGSSRNLVFAADEAIVTVEACGDKRALLEPVGVVYLRVETNKGQKLEGGRKKGVCKTWKAPGNKWGLVGFKGRRGKELDQLRVIWGVVF